VDETLSVSTREQLGNVTVQWCLIAESLNCSVHRKGCHGYGSLVRGSWGNAYSFHHNLYAHHRGRSPRPGNYNDHSIDPNGLILDFRNNVIYNWGGSYAGYNADTDSVTKINFVGNYYKTGPDSTGRWAFREKCPHSKGYFAGNCMNGKHPQDPWDLTDFVDFSDVQKEAYKQPKAFPAAPVSTDDALTAFERVLAGVGATLPLRDAVDIRIVNDVKNGTGKIIDDEEQVGGWPPLKWATAPADSDHDGIPDEWEQAKGLNQNDPADGRADPDGDGYTNVEEYLNGLCAAQTRKP
jgi:hypothetical protein